MKPTDKKIWAVFHPQAWINGQAVEIDAEGETTFDVTDEILFIGKEHALRLKDDSFETDYWRTAESAPQWIKDWLGPFYIEIENSIACYFEDED